MRAWREKMKRQGITIISADHAKARQLFEERKAAAELRARAKLKT